MPTWVKVAIDAWTAPAGVVDGYVFRPVNRGDQVQVGAKSALAEREGVKADNIQKHIGWWSQTSKSDGKLIAGIREWATQRALDGVVWTALPPKFEGTEGRVPTGAELVAFFRSLPYEKRRHAEEYVRRAPLQIDTENRRVIELELGWCPIIDGRVME